MGKKKIAILMVSLISVVSALLLQLCHAASEPFPVYPGIVANVRFWIDVYSKFPTTKGILHDSYDLSIVYGVIELLPPDKHGAPRENAKRIRVAKEKYRKILKNLAEDHPSEDSETLEIAALFAPKADPSTYRKAMKNIRCQVGQRDRFEEGFTRSRPYLDKIKEIFRSNELPEDLAYIPHVESSFNPKAYSKAGAAGIWQFTRSTGKKFMKVGRGLDERRDPIRSSEAAAELLEHNYRILGSWPLAITAYNHGISGLSKARKTKGGEEAIFSAYRTRRFKFASRNFYCEFLAARHVAKNYGQYFGFTEDNRSASEAVPIEESTQMCASCPQDNADAQNFFPVSPVLKQTLRE